MTQPAPNDTPASATARFTDQQRHVATAATIRMPWNGGKNGKYFRCKLCGHKFDEGDGYRWVYSRRFSNLMVCDSCDGPDVLERWIAANEELERRFWWALERE